MLMPGPCAYTGSDPYCHGNVSAQARAQGTFRTLIGALAVAKVIYRPLYFSYHVNQPGTYTVGDTHQSVARSVDALEAQLRSVWNRDHSARFDLVGHSLGGVVAASWAVSNGRRYGYDSPNGLLRYVNSIVTYDSPLRGISSRYVSNLVTRILGGTVWYSLQPDSETIKEITFFPDSWWKSTGHLHTIANSADEIVPPPEALLGDRKLVLDGRCSADLLFLKTCHGPVLQTPHANRDADVDCDADRDGHPDDHDRDTASARGDGHTVTHRERYSVGHGHTNRNTHSNQNVRPGRGVVLPVPR
jgi:hypothetical protein